MRRMGNWPFWLAYPLTTFQGKVVMDRRLFARVLLLCPRSPINRRTFDTLFPGPGSWKWVCGAVWVVWAERAALGLAKQGKCKVGCGGVPLCATRYLPPKIVVWGTYLRGSAPQAGCDSAAPVTWNHQPGPRLPPQTPKPKVKFQNSKFKSRARPRSGCFSSQATNTY